MVPLYTRFFDSKPDADPLYESAAYPSIYVDVISADSTTFASIVNGRLVINGFHVYTYHQEDGSGAGSKGCTPCSARPEPRLWRPVLPSFHPGSGRASFSAALA